MARSLCYNEVAVPPALRKKRLLMHQMIREQSSVCASP
jgi:hypothetical protein